MEVIGYNPTQPYDMSLRGFSQSLKENSGLELVSLESEQLKESVNTA